MELRQHVEAPNGAVDVSRPPVLSVLIPFFRDNPLPLFRELAAQNSGHPDTVEILLFDDGAPDPELNVSVREEIADSAVAARLLTSSRNLGRAGARNSLAAAARAPWVLFLDAEMSIPAGFLARHIEAARSGRFDAAFGGCTAEPPNHPDLALHAAVVKASEAADAATRSKRGALAFGSGNLLVRSEVIRRVPFDEGFAAWGWEDVDWAATAARDYCLAHIDNPIGRLPSDRPETLLRKFRSAADSYRRLLEKHPNLARAPGGRAALALKRLPGQGYLRGVLSHGVRVPWLPTPARILLLRLWRASWAAEAISIRTKGA